MSNEKFDIKEFRNRAGLINPGLFHYHKKNGHVPEKTVFTQKDVDEYTAKHQNKTRNESSSGELSKKQFAEAIGANYKNIFNLVKYGKVPKKDKYTQQDVLDFKEKHSVAKVPGTGRKEGVPQKNGYTRKQFAEEIGDISYAGITTAITRGHIPHKELYTLADIEKFRKERKAPGGLERKPKEQHFDHKRSSTPKTVREFEKVIAKNSSVAIDDSEIDNPFEIRTGVVASGNSTPFLEKLIARMLTLEVYSISNNQYVHVPASIYVTNTKASTAFAAAKNFLISTYPALSKASYSITNKKNEEGVYTHSQIIRTA